MLPMHDDQSIIMEDGRPLSEREDDRGGVKLENLIDNSKYRNRKFKK